MKNNMVIMAMGYNRPHSLSRLLYSLNAINNIEGIKLIISIDAGNNSDVIKVAESFIWKYGEKEIIVHKNKLGLKNHFFFSGDLTEKYDNVLFVEDDLVVSPNCVCFADEIISKYKDDKTVAGASLYNPQYMEGIGLRFYKIEDGYDVYFFQQPYWGNVWMKEKWNDFKKWYQKYRYSPEVLPKHIKQWPDTSFKKIYIQYLIETNRFFVTPRVSLCTNFADPGLHLNQSTNIFQCPYSLKGFDFRLPNFEESMAVYDAFFEISPYVLYRECPWLKKYDLTVNILKRKIVNTRYTITTSKTNKVIREFCDSTRPKEISILNNMEGKGIVLTLTTDVVKSQEGISAQLSKDIIQHYGIDLYDIYKMLVYVILRKYRAYIMMIKKILK